MPARAYCSEHLKIASNVSLGPLCVTRVATYTPLTAAHARPLRTGRFSAQAVTLFALWLCGDSATRQDAEQRAMACRARYDTHAKGPGTLS